MALGEKTCLLLQTKQEQKEIKIFFIGEAKSRKLQNLRSAERFYCRKSMGGFSWAFMATGLLAFVFLQQPRTGLAEERVNKDLPQFPSTYTVDGEWWF